MSSAPHTSVAPATTPRAFSPSPPRPLWDELRLASPSLQQGGRWPGLGKAFGKATGRVLRQGVGREPSGDVPRVPGSGRVRVSGFSHAGRPIIRSSRGGLSPFSRPRVLPRHFTSTLRPGLCLSFTCPRGQTQDNARSDNPLHTVCSTEVLRHYAFSGSGVNRLCKKICSG